MRVSGTCAREEGLRILTSPRREASLFKLGRNLVFRPFFFVRQNLPSVAAVDDGDADGFERIVGDRRHAELAVAFRPDDAALEERALILDLQPLAGLARRPHCKAGERQVTAACAGVIAVADPGGGAAFLGKNAELDRARREAFARADA